MKIATLLFAIMACTILIRILEDKSVKRMNDSFVSMYNDRLIPATDLFYIAENFYAKKQAMDLFFYGDGPVYNNLVHVGQQLSKLNTDIDSLVRKYEKTFLVKSEKEHLLELKERLAVSAEAEQKVLTLSTGDTAAGGRKLYETVARKRSGEAVAKMNELMDIQTKVGQELIEDSAFMVSRSKLYSTLQIALAIVIGGLIVAIISASNVTQIRNDKFNLN